MENGKVSRSFTKALATTGYHLLLLMQFAYSYDAENSTHYWVLPEVSNAMATGAIYYTPPVAKQNYKTCDDLFSKKYRTADGSCNNRFNLGTANTPPRRLLPNAYDDLIDAPRSRDTAGLPLPEATEVSRHVHPVRDVFQGFTVMLMQWGQFLDHDMTGFPITSAKNGSIKCCGNNGELPDPEESQNQACNVIRLSDEDKRFKGKCMEFVRSTPATDEQGQQIFPREQVNGLTAFIDGSTIYGSSQEVQDELREIRDGSRGFLMRMSDGRLLPRNPSPEELCVHGPGEFCFQAGDIRVNEHPALIAMHTVFVRLHNLLAPVLNATRQNASYEDIFQETRKIVIAIIQNINYREWLPLILGSTSMQHFRLETGSRSTFIPDLDPQISNEFATAAFRFGHSLIPRGLNISGRFVNFRTVFNQPGEVFRSFDDVIKALVSPLLTSGSNTLDRYFTREVTGHLFESENLGDDTPSGGLDLVALNTQRGRDHGLQPYNKYRRYCGLPALRSFQDLPEEVAEAMQQVYRSVDDIDLFSGLMTETRLPDAMVGPTLSCLLCNQFHALKFADRFYYETDRMPEGFTDDQLTAIREVKLSHVLCAVTAVDQVQLNAFIIPSHRNELLDCHCVRNKFLDLSLWKREH